jgi:hypothetical protein
MGIISGILEVQRVGIRKIHKNISHHTNNNNNNNNNNGARGSVVGSVATLKAGRSSVPLPMRYLIFFNYLNPFSRIMAPCLTQLVTEKSIKKSSWRVKHGRRVRLTTSLPSVSQLTRKCEILDISQPYRSPQG